MNAKKQQKKNLKIMFATETLAMGGAERVLSELANYFAEQGHELSILLCAKNIIEYDLNRNINIIPVCNELIQSKLHINKIYKFMKIRKAVKKAAPDIVISFFSPLRFHVSISLLFTKYRTIECEGSDPRRIIGNKKIKLFQIVGSRHHGSVCFQTGAAMDYYPRHIKKKAAVIPNPLKSNLPERYKGKRSKKIVAVGRLVKIKNYKLLINAFSKFDKLYPGYKLHIYGQGPENNKLAEQTAKLNISDKVKFMGVKKNVHEEIVDASAYILTSDMEGMPNSLWEAMAIGLPCISSDCSGGSPLSLIVHGENGFIFPSGNEDKLLDCMKELIPNKQLVERFSRNSVKTRKDFELSKIAQMWLDLILRTIK